MWQLERPKPALPASYFWTWDHSTNWVLDDPGVLNWGCDNRYLKQPETFVEDYRRLTDLAAGLGVKGLLIWGFLRDAHGGVVAGKLVADYAAANGVAIMPGLGTTDYGGVYYEGEHPYSIGTFLREHPDAHLIAEDGWAFPASVCPSHPAFREWMSEGIEWLFREFAIGGANLENGDFLVCHCPRCKAHKESWPADDPEFFRLQAMSYLPALETIGDDRLAQKLVTWATYTGFVPGEPFKTTVHMTGNMQCDYPEINRRVPKSAITQWTLTGMVRPLRADDPATGPLPLSAYLDDGAPEAALDTPNWPRDLRPPGPRSVGFLHQGSQWSGATRYEIVVSTIKESCLRAYRSGLEGVSIHGEATARYIPCALNYLAFSHFIHWPEDSLREFGRKTLGQVLGGEEDGEAYIELLASWESGTLTAAQRDELTNRMKDLNGQVMGGSRQALDRARFWGWLHANTHGSQDKMTVSIF